MKILKRLWFVISIILWLFGIILSAITGYFILHWILFDRNIFSDLTDLFTFEVQL
jgi:hypothetical protein